MALIVQDDTGLVVGATTYVSVATFRAYWDARNPAYKDDDDAIAIAVAQGSDYVDRRYGYRGRKLNGRQQRQQFPRINCFDADRLPVQGIPQEVKDATCEYAFRALAGTLNPDPTIDPSGLAVAKVSKTVGPITKDVEFFEGDGVAALPNYPGADLILKRGGFILSSGTMLRA